MAYLYKRGKTWWAQSQTGGFRRRRSLGTPTKSVARKRAETWEKELVGLQFSENPTRLYEEAMASFITNHLPTLRPNSQTRYRVSVRQLNKHFLGYRLDQISSTMLSDYELTRRAEGTSAPTIRRDLACLSSMFTHAVVDLEWVDVNPVPAFLTRQKRRGRLRESPPRTRYLSHEEEDKLLAAASDDMRQQIMFMIDTGLRTEETYSLTWDTVNLTRREVTVRAENAKGGVERTVPLLPRSTQLLPQVKRRRRATGEPDYVFCKEDGSRYLSRHKGFANIVRRAGLKDLKPHDLRRTCGCRLLQDLGFRKEDVQKWLGHESFVTTENVYAFLELENLHERTQKSTQGKWTRGMVKEEIGE